MQKTNASPGHNIWDIEQAGRFLKASSSLVGPSQGIAQRFLERRTDFEVELVAVIGREAAMVAKKDALEWVGGYWLGLDITVRGPEDRSFRKSIDSYTVLGPWLTSADEVPDPQQLRLSVRQNGELRQDTSTSDMLWDVARLIQFASGFYTPDPRHVRFNRPPACRQALPLGDG